MSTPNKTVWSLEAEKRGNPAVTVCGIEEEVKAEDVIRDIYAENPKVREGLTMGEWTGAVKFLAKRRGRARGMVDLVLTVEPHTHAKLIAAGRVSVGKLWKRLLERYDVTRCFRYSRFGHKAADCSKKECCARCEGAHQLRECRDEDMECPNCKRAGRRERRHRATSSACPEYQRRIREKKERFGVSSIK